MVRLQQVSPPDEGLRRAKGDSNSTLKFKIHAETHGAPTQMAVFAKS